MKEPEGLNSEELDLIRRALMSRAQEHAGYGNTLMSADYMRVEAKVERLQRWAKSHIPIVKVDA